MPLRKQKKESQSKPSKRPCGSRAEIRIVAFKAHEMGLEQEHRFKTAVDVLLTEIVRQKISRGKQT
jgi:hypothetical protein